MHVERSVFRARSIFLVETGRRGNGGNNARFKVFAFTPNCSPTNQVRREGRPEAGVCVRAIANERLHDSTEQRQLPASRGRPQAAASRNPGTGSRVRRRTPRQDPRGVGAPADPATPAERHHLQSDGELSHGDRGTGPKTFSETESLAQR